MHVLDAPHLMCLASASEKGPFQIMGSELNQKVGEQKQELQWRHMETTDLR